MDFRRMEMRDFEQVRLLSQNLAQMHAQQRPDIFLPPEAMTKKEFKKRAVGKEAFGFVATDGASVAAYCFCRVKAWGQKNKVACPRRILWIDQFCVDSAFRSKGVGTALTQYIRKTAVQLGCNSIELEVWAFNEDARAFYTKQGFSEQSRLLELSVLQNPSES